MELTAAKCPNCQAKIQIDPETKNGFCSYCGSQIIPQEAIHHLKVSGKVSVEGVNTTAQLKANAQRSYDVKQYDNAERDWKRVIDLDATDHEAYWGQILCHIAKYPATKFFSTEYPHSILNNMYDSALAYAPPETKAKYQAFAKKHNISAEAEIHERARIEKEHKRLNSPRSGCLGGICAFIAVPILIGTIIETSYGSEFAFLLWCLFFTALIGALFFFRKPKK